MRWVVACALLLPSLAACAPDGGAASAGDAASAASPTDHEFVLAVSWEPGFCATDDGRGKRECQTMTPDRFDATHFSLHGLWPDDLDDAEIYPCYCSHGAPVSCEQSEPADQVRVSDDVFRRLRVLMPGTRSGLHRHEWTKHGTCYGADVDTYFSDAIVLIDRLNASPIQQLFENRIGENLSLREIESAIDKAFGEGAADRVVLRCDGRGRDRVITGIDINLKGVITPGADLGDLILAAPPVAPGAQCGGGKVSGATS